jgi:GMP synthase (glutamine-hydrolysing)
MPKILFLQATPVAIQEEIGKLKGGRASIPLFLESLEIGQQGRAADGEPTDAIEHFVLNVSDLENLPQGLEITDFDGVIITGSPLNAYKDEPAVRHQLDLCRAVYHSGVPTFGSCWGVQIMSAALGGSVRLNPNGREFGIARNIFLTDEGRGHPLYRGKDPGFDALCSHEDEVESLPPDATLLASNSMSRVQALDITDGDKSFWGVQYHPEFDFPIIAALMQRKTQRHVADGYATSDADVAATTKDYYALAESPSDLIWKYGVSPNITDPVRRRLEFRNWLDTKVYPHMSAAR